MSKKRTRKPRTKRMYFTKVHEDAIIEYNNSTDFARKTELYETLIHPALDEMVDKIVYTYKFNTLPNISDLQQDCKVFLVTILHKYNPDKNSKAFSYFSVIAKNWFIAQVKKNAKKNKKEVSLENHLGMGLIQNTALVAEDSWHEQQERKEFMNLLSLEIESWNSLTMRPNERKVYEAIKTLLSNADKLEIFNKKAIYLYLREITGLNTKQIVAQLSKMREKYREFKSNYDNGIE
ncbi:MAG: hypothetical protein GOVbin703_60 [Prokaryotic dsDNA virus sp.]|nr:MAG: hypothetical protein GOVbin703_60 [Prokaryotic dsDNA virus sp.]